VPAIALSLLLASAGTVIIRHAKGITRLKKHAIHATSRMNRIKPTVQLEIFTVTMSRGSQPNNNDSTVAGPY
jgi:hypothetical protein